MKRHPTLPLNCAAVELDSVAPTEQGFYLLEDGFVMLKEGDAKVGKFVGPDIAIDHVAASGCRIARDAGRDLIDITDPTGVTVRLQYKHGWWLVPEGFRGALRNRARQAELSTATVHQHARAEAMRFADGVDFGFTLVRYGMFAFGVFVAFRLVLGIGWFAFGY